MVNSEITNAGDVPEKKIKLEDKPVLKFVKLSENATTPSKGSQLSAGYDLYRWKIFYLINLINLLDFQQKVDFMNKILFMKN